MARHDDDSLTLSRESGSKARLLFSKGKVYLHPTPAAKDNVAGYIALLEKSPAGLEDVERGSTSLLLAWIPESGIDEVQKFYAQVDLSTEDSPTRAPLVPEPPMITSSFDQIGSHAFAVSLSSIYSLLIRPPNLGWWFGSIVINTRMGTSLPALFFHDDECRSTDLQKKKRLHDDFDPFAADGSTFWGGDEVLRWLRRYLDVQRSGADASIYLIEPSTEDVLGFASVSPQTASGSKDTNIDPISKAFKQARWNFLEKMSQVTNFTRRAALDLTESPSIPPQVRRLMKNPDVQVLQEEFDSARIYLAKWAMTVAEQGDRGRRQRLMAASVVSDEASSVEAFELHDVEQRRTPVTKAEWSSFFDPQGGTLQRTVSEVKERIFRGGLDPHDGVRKEAWLFLLGVHDWSSTSEQRRHILSEKREEFIRLKTVWWNKLMELEQDTDLKEQKGRIEKDVHRTDRHIPLFEGEDIPHPDPDSPFADVGTNVHLEQLKDLLMTYNEYNRDLGYVQGMSDLLAPIYAVEQDDAIAFWAFAGFMQRMEKNFLRDQSGMRKQLLTLDHLVQFVDPDLYLHLQKADSINFFFFFRMLLVWYKREFEWADILRLWEALWTDFLTRDFHLFIALAILDKNKDALMQLRRFDEVLKYSMFPFWLDYAKRLSVNDLSGNIDLRSTLIRAEALFQKFQRMVEAVDKKDNFPSPRPGPKQDLPTVISVELRSLLER